MVSSPEDVTVHDRAHGGVEITDRLRQSTKGFILWNKVRNHNHIMIDRSYRLYYARWSVCNVKATSPEKKLHRPASPPPPQNISFSKPAFFFWFFSLYFLLSRSNFNGTLRYGTVRFEARSVLVLQWGRQTRGALACVRLKSLL